MTRPAPVSVRWTALVVLASLAPVAHAAKPPAWTPTTWSAADSLVLAPPSPERSAAIEAWAQAAPLEDVVWLLRRSPRDLGELERPLLQGALDRAPAERTSLRDALAARLAQLPPPPSAKKRKKGDPAPPPPPSGSTDPVIPSVHRVALALPSHAGDGDADAVAAGFVSGLASRGVPGRPPVECVRVSTRTETPEEFAAALDSVARVAGALCGGTTPASALLASAASRWEGIPVVVLAEGDLSPSRVSSRAWSLGPTGTQRARALAGMVKPEKKDRVAFIVSSAADTAFVSGFVAACRSRGATIVGRVVYAPGNASFTGEIRALIGQRASVLFWDGDPPEAAALLRQLTRERVSLRICGGEGLAPDRHHRETRVFLEGVTYAEAAWGLGAAEQSRLDSSLAAAGAGPADDRHVRGDLAGRLLGAAIATGALTREELGAALARLATDPSEGPGSLDPHSQGGALPVYTVQAGTPRRVQ